ncbi:MAG: hypothetical protein K2W96_08905 [Gemmataceae bacterium]|nr:hypothetical protein [Gemmataceae bacterium]
MPPLIGLLFERFIVECRIPHGMEEAMNPGRYLSMVLLAACACDAGAQSADKERAFPEWKCKAKLPGPEWRWNDAAKAPVVVQAVRPDDFALTLVCDRLPAADLDSQIPTLERGFFQPGVSSKRGTRFVSFKGVRCYQMEATHDATGQTIVSRMFITHGTLYALTVSGGKEPVENDPAFMTILDSFSFIEQPPAPAPVLPPAPPAEAPSSEYSDALTVSAWMGSIVGVCLIGIVVLLIVRAVAGKKKPTSEDDEDDEDDEERPRRKRRVEDEGDERPRRRSRRED